jgi:predicted GNAT family N-acyltransferase
VTGSFRVRLADWPTDAVTLKSIRHDVFVIEQSVPADLEWDGIDGNCRHAIAEEDSGASIGCGRLLPDGHIGRMAVRRQWRGQGVGAALLERLIALARELGYPRVVLNAQTHACPFYARFGFVACGSEFNEAGIPHQAMERELSGARR